MPESGTPILIVGSCRKEIVTVQKQLKDSGYVPVPACGPEALARLSEGEVRLIVATAAEAQPESEDASRPGAGQPTTAILEPRNSTGLEETIRVVAAEKNIPILWIGSVCDDSALKRALQSEADYFLFAPYEREDLLRAMRGALLNGPVRESREPVAAIEFIHQDRKHRVTTGRARLARLGFSALEQLRHCSTSLSWSRAETRELRRQLQQEREQFQLRKMLPEVVQGVAHDFNNLLETVSAAATVLRSQPSDPTPYRKAIDAALAQAGMLVNTLQDWTDWQEEPPPSEPVDLGAVAREVMEAALLPLRAPNIRVRTEVENLPPVRANRFLLSRAILNLVWNAVQAMPNGGMLSLLGYAHKHRVVLEISDTGGGIPPKNRQRIFEPHFSTKNGHTGMGLYLVRQLVQRCGGEISFASHPGRGSCFALAFAVALPAATPPQKTARRGRRLHVR